MIGVSQGIVLSRRAYGEADRLASIYTPDLGRVTLRFIGVLKSKSKLKALSEPMVRGEFRLHLKGMGDTGRCLGGQLATVYPGIRLDYERTCAALTLLEQVERLTPERLPHPAKFQLLAETLACLEAGGSVAPGSAGTAGLPPRQTAPNPWLPIAFTLRLLDLSGLRPLEPEAPSERPLWEALLDAPLSSLAALPGEPERLAGLRRLAAKHVELQLDRPLKSAAFAS